MKRVIKKTLHGFSLVALMLLVFSNGLIGKVTGSHTRHDGSDTPEDSIFSAFATTPVHAETPIGGDSGSAGCSADSAGSSACGASAGDAAT